MVWLCRRAGRETRSPKWRRPRVPPSRGLIEPQKPSRSLARMRICPCRDNDRKPFRGQPETFLPSVKFARDYPRLTSRRSLRAAEKVVETVAGRSAGSYIAFLKDAGIKVIHKCNLGASFRCKAQFLGCECSVGRCFECWVGHPGEMIIPKHDTCCSSGDDLRFPLLLPAGWPKRARCRCQALAPKEMKHGTMRFIATPGSGRCTRTSNRPSLCSELDTGLVIAFAAQHRTVAGNMLGESRRIISEKRKRLAQDLQILPTSSRSDEVAGVLIPRIMKEGDMEIGAWSFCRYGPLPDPNDIIPTSANDLIQTRLMPRADAT